MSDGRRRQWVPLSVYFARTKSGVALRRHFGRDGLLVWVCYLAACKASVEQGQLVYASEAEAWDKLGLADDRPDFALDAFWSVTGRLHLTVRRRQGELVTVACRAWDEWNSDVKRQNDAERSARKRRTNTATVARQSGDDSPTDSDNDSDSDYPPTPHRVGGLRANGENPRAIAERERDAGAPERRARAWIANGLAAEVPPDRLEDVLEDEFDIEPELAHELANIARGRDPDDEDAF